MFRGIVKTLLVGALLVSASAYAGVGIKSVVIVPCTDGNIYSTVIDGDCSPPPAYEALSWDAACAGLTTAGDDTLVHGTPFAYDVRTNHLLGTNAATAVISIEAETGDDATNAGFSIETGGAGDDVLFSSTSNTAKSGTYQLKADDTTSCTPPDCSTDNTVACGWAMSADGGSSSWPNEDPEVLDRDISFESDFESGQINALTSTQTIYGRIIAKDTWSIIALEPDCSFTINDITDNDSTADFTWNAGCGPSLREGFQLGDATGMNEVDGRLFRGLSLTGAGTSSGSGQLWQDEDDDGCCVPSSWGTNGTPELPSQRTSTVGYGNFSGTVTATTFKKTNYQNGCCGVGYDEDNPLRVVSDAGGGFIPPGNTLDATPDPVFCLRGTFCMSTQMNYWQPYDVWNNAPSAGYVNHRWSMSTNPSTATRAWCDYDEECWSSWAIYLPSNYDHNDIDATGNDQNFDATALEFYLMGQIGNGDAGLIAMWLAGGPGGVDQFFVGAHDPVLGSTNNTKIPAGSVAPAIGHWTCFVANFKANVTTGFAKVWKHLSCEDNDPADISVILDVTGGTADNTFTTCNGGNCQVAQNPRNYKYGWNANRNTTPQTVIWIGYDEIRFGSASGEGTTFSDVHPGGLSEP